ncbi:MAG: pectate lyase [Planctomycetota bacterium]
MVSLRPRKACPGLHSLLANSARRLAPPVWACFYDLEANRPFFCDRDGVPPSSSRGYFRPAELLRTSQK